MTLLIALLLTQVSSTDAPIRRSETQTLADMTLFINPAGSNAERCTFAKPCQTLNGAFARIPKTVRHNVIIMADAGTYPAETTIVEDLNILAGQVLVQGSMARATPATGANSGTLTSVTNTAPLPVFTDSSQSWTTNDLRGRHIRVTSGSAANNIGVIISNTATTLTLASPVSGTVVATNTYEIVQPAVVFQGNQGSSDADTAVLNVRGIRGRSIASTAGRLAFSQVSIQQLGTATSALRFGELTGPRFECSECALTGGVVNAAGSTVSAVALARTVVTASSAGGAGAFFWSGGAIRAFLGPTYWRASAGVTWRLTGNASIAVSQATNQVIETGLTTTAAFRSNGGSVLLTASGPSTGFVAICPSGSTTGVGVWLESSIGLSNEFSTPILTVQNCATGVLVEGPSYLAVTGVVTHTTGTTGISVTRGGRVRLTGAPALTGVGTELSLDGTAQTLSTLNAASPQVLTTVYGSHISR